MNLSVVIVNWRSRDYLMECLSSLRLNGLPDSQVVVVDNASDDGCGEALARDFPDVRFIQSETNLGFAGANNLGARDLTTDWILFLNPDTELPAGTLKRLMGYAESRPKAGVLGVRLLNTDGSVQISSVQPQMSAISPLLSSRRLYAMRTGKFWLTPGPIQVPGVSGACMLVRRAAFEAVGRWDDAYHMYAEDADLCTSMRKAGWQVLHVPVQVIHHGGKSSDQAPFGWKARQMIRARVQYLRKHRNRTIAGVHLACSHAVQFARSVRHRV